MLAWVSLVPFTLVPVRLNIADDPALQRSGRCSPMSLVFTHIGMFLQERGRKPSTGPGQVPCWPQSCVCVCVRWQIEFMFSPALTAARSSPPAGSTHSLGPQLSPQPEASETDHYEDSAIFPRKNLGWPRLGTQWEKQPAQGLIQTTGKRDTDSTPRAGPHSPAASGLPGAWASLSHRLSHPELLKQCCNSVG